MWVALLHKGVQKHSGRGLLMASQCLSGPGDCMLAGIPLNCQEHPEYACGQQLCRGLATC